MCVVGFPAFRRRLRRNRLPCLAAPRPVGTLVRWTASATNTAASTLDYRFSIRPPGGVFRTARDYGRHRRSGQLARSLPEVAATAFLSSPLKIRLIGPSSIEQPVLVHLHSDERPRSPGCHRSGLGELYSIRRHKGAEYVVLHPSWARRNITRVSEQLVAMGKQQITSFHHDSFRLPNGNTAILCSTERIFKNVQGQGPVDVVGDAIVVLNQNLQVVWFWDAFEHLDVSRKAILDEKCNAATARLSAR